MSGRIDLKSVRLKTAQKYSNWLLFYLFFQKQAPFSVPSPELGGTEGGVKTIEERLGEKGGAFFNGKEGRDDFRTPFFNGKEGRVGFRKNYLNIFRKESF